ncbi:MAG: nitrate/nitrite transporter NrtS [Actinomycetota bacterium]|nr:nitrate/nitrite transporter NrtS [Actinomycetota bacterium]
MGADTTGPPRRSADRPSAPPAWSSVWDFVVLVARGHTWRTATRVALVVGTILSAVNQGAVIASGRFGVAAGVRVAVNYLVPFTVASIGYLAPFRRRRRPGPGE